MSRTGQAYAQAMSPPERDDFRTLSVNVLRQAWRDLSARDPNGRNPNQTRMDALRWFAEAGEDFRRYCGAMEYDADCVRNAILSKATTAELEQLEMEGYEVMSHNEERIIDVLKEAGQPLTATEIVELTGMNKGGCTGRLTLMAQAGKLLRSGSPFCYSLPEWSVQNGNGDHGTAAEPLNGSTASADGFVSLPAPPIESSPTEEAFEPMPEVSEAAIDNGPAGPGPVVLTLPTGGYVKVQLTAHDLMGDEADDLLILVRWMQRMLRAAEARTDAGRE